VQGWMGPARKPLAVQRVAQHIEVALALGEQIGAEVVVEGVAPHDRVPLGDQHVADPPRQTREHDEPQPRSERAGDEPADHRDILTGLRQPACPGSRRRRRRSASMPTAASAGSATSTGIRYRCTANEIATVNVTTAASTRYGQIGCRRRRSTTSPPIAATT